MKSNSDLSGRPRKTSNVAKTTKTEVKLENGRRIERRTETINEDGKETKMIFENNKLGNYSVKSTLLTINLIILIHIFSFDFTAETVVKKTVNGELMKI